MNSELLNEIVPLADEKQIREKLTELGFRDAKTDPELKSTNFVYLIQGTLYETEQDYYNKDKKSLWGGNICVENREHSGMLYILIEKSAYSRKYNGYVSEKFIIYAKEL